MILDPEFVKKVDEYALNGDFKGMDEYVNSHPDLVGKETADYTLLHLKYYFGKVMEYGQYQYEKDFLEFYWHIKRYDLLIDFAITATKYHCGLSSILAVRKYYYKMNESQMKEFESIISNKISLGEDDYHYLGMLLYGTLFFTMYLDKEGDYPNGMFGYSMDQAYQPMVDYYQYVKKNDILPAYLKENQKFKSDWCDELIQKISEIIATKKENDGKENSELLRLIENKELHRNTSIKIAKGDLATIAKIEQLVKFTDIADESIFVLILECSYARVDQAEKLSKDEKIDGLKVDDLFEIGKIYFGLGPKFHFQAKMIFYYATMKDNVDSSYYFAYMLDKGLGKRPFSSYHDRYDRLSESFYSKVVLGDITKCGWYYKSAKMGNKKAIEHLDRLIMSGDLEAMLYSGKY